MIPCWVKVVFWLLALGASTFYGLFAVDIFVPVKTLDDIKKKHQPAWLVHQAWLNFAGSIVGWACLWVVCVKVWPFVSRDSFESLTWGDAALAFVAFLGVTGYIPYTATAIARTASGAITKAAGIGKE
jgi:hypothetical protein